MQENDKNENAPLHLDYTIKDDTERVALVQKIIDTTPPEKLTPRYLEILSNYIVFNQSLEENDRKILTPSRMYTIKKRETSFEGLVEKLNAGRGNADNKKAGEDVIYNMMTNDKNIILDPKNKITKEEIDEIPGLADFSNEIDKIQQKFKEEPHGKNKSSYLKTLIDMRRDRYTIRAGYKPTIAQQTRKGATATSIEIYEEIEMNPETKEPVVKRANVSLLVQDHVVKILDNYADLKQSNDSKVRSDFYYLMEEVDSLINQTFKDKYPVYYDLIQYKIDKKTNAEIQKMLKEKHNITYSIEYISSLWKNKIPKMLVNQAQENYIVWYYKTTGKGTWKTCSKCGQTKLAHNRFFSKNKTSKDGFYSICKECRNKKINYQKG